MDKARALIFGYAEVCAVFVDQTLAMLGRNFDVVTENVVVPDFQGGNTGPICVGRLQAGDQFAAIVTQRLQFIERAS